mgnify:CR=1 FL=1
MHTYTTATIVIHHNGDYKGECIIVDIDITFGKIVSSENNVTTVDSIHNYLDCIVHICNTVIINNDRSCQCDSP